MNTCGRFETHRYKISGCKNGETIYLMFFGDVHRDSPLCAVDHWRQFLDYWKEKSKRYRCYGVGMGDYLDGFSTSERMLLAEDGKKGLHEGSKRNIEAMQLGMINILAKELDFAKGNIIGLISGNHYTEFQDGTNSDQKLCGLLGCKFLGVQAFIRLSFTRGISSPGPTNTIDMMLHHGKGAARLIGSSFHRVEQMLEMSQADILAMGHDHRRGIVPAGPRLYLTHGSGKLQVKQRQPWLIRSGSFLKAFVPGEASYNVDAGRGPCSLGHVELEVTIERTTSRPRGSDTTELRIRGIA